MTPVWITTSWDDGHQLDHRLADLLDGVGAKGTFYVARDYLAPEVRLSEPEIAALAARHEIGAHTLTHPILTAIPMDQAREEIAGSRAWLEDVTGQHITAFCYPRGSANPALRDLVARAGYAVARTVEPYRLDAGRDPLLLPTSVQVYPFPLRPVDSLRARFEPVRRVLPRVRPLHLPLLALLGWPSLARALLDRAAATGGVWHLWGHSWEVEKYGMWGALEQALACLREYPDARFVTNTELAQAVFHVERSGDVLQHP